MPLWNEWIHHSWCCAEASGILLLQNCAAHFRCAALLFLIWHLQHVWMEKNHTLVWNAGRKWHSGACLTKLMWKCEKKNSALSYCQSCDYRWIHSVFEKNMSMKCFPASPRLPLLYFAHSWPAGLLAPRWQVSGASVPSVWPRAALLSRSLQQ